MKQSNALLAIGLLQVALLVLLVYRSEPTVFEEKDSVAKADSIPRERWNGQSVPTFKVNDSESYMTEPQLISQERGVMVYAVYNKTDGQYFLYFSQSHAPWGGDFRLDIDTIAHKAAGYRADLGITFAFGNAESVHSSCEFVRTEYEDIFAIKLDCYDLVRFVQYDLRSIKLTIEAGGETLWPIDDAFAIQRHLFRILQRTAFAHEVG